MNRTKETNDMALETVRRSDASGKEIKPGTGARVRVMFNDKSKNDMKADLTDEEIKKLMPWLNPVEPRPSRRGGVQSRFATDET
jgi:hypothetical protein